MPSRSAVPLPGGEQRGRTPSRLFHSAGAGASGRSDVSERMEELLAEPTASRDALAADD